jgi:hypothetical protein
MEETMEHDDFDTHPDVRDGRGDEPTLPYLDRARADDYDFAFNDIGLAMRVHQERV